MIIVLSVGVAFLAIAAMTRSKLIGFIFWFPIIPTCLIIGILTCNGFPHLQTGPGGLSALGLIPVFINWGLCAIFALISLLILPKRTTVSIATGTVVGYSILAYFILNTPAIWGFYTVDIQVVDWNRKPVVGITVKTTREEDVSYMLINTMIPQGGSDELVTDNQGHVKLRANRYALTQGYINWDNPRQNSSYGGTHFFLTSEHLDAGRFYAEWNRPDEPMLNQHTYTADFHFHSATSYVIFLPNVGKDDSSMYEKKMKDGRE